MPDNKNQHFVPRCHLRPFTVGEEGRRINLYNLDHQRSIFGTSVRNQCSGDYFYGDDERLERAIKTVEDAYAPVLRSLTGKNPTIDAKIEVVLKRFIYLQYLRTEAASRRSVEMIQEMLDMPGEDTHFPDFKQEVRKAVIFSMLTYSDTMGIVDDLKLRIVKNCTDIPLVTSDDPAVMTNRLHLQKMHPRWKGFGSKSAGAIFILPLSPSLCCILLDGDIYSAPHSNKWIECSKNRDISALNEQQYIGCYANIYFHDWEKREIVANAAEEAKLRRLETSHTVNHAILDHESEWGKRYAVISKDKLKSTSGEVLVHITNNTPEPENWPSFLRYRSDRKVAYFNDTGAGYTRLSCLEQGFVTGDGYRKVRL